MNALFDGLLAKLLVKFECLANSPAASVSFGRTLKLGVTEDQLYG